MVYKVSRYQEKTINERIMYLNHRLKGLYALKNELHDAITDNEYEYVCICIDHMVSLCKEELIQLRNCL